MGIIYVLTNPVMPGLVKIGKTDRLEERVKILSSSSSVPVRFVTDYAREVKDADRVERGLHTAFGEHRINPKREFFRISPQRVIAALELAPGRDVTPGSDPDVDSVEQNSLIKEQIREQRRQANFNFSMVGIKSGDVLSFARGGDKFQATVIDDRNVEFEGEVMSLSSSAKKILERNFNTGWTSARGPDFWTYEGEALSDRRIRFEEGNDLPDKADLLDIADNETATTFALTVGRGGIIARMVPSDSEFIVLEGSRADDEKSSISDSVKSRRQDLIQQGILQKSADASDYIFTRDCRFHTPSGAASIVRGGSANGLREWKLLDSSGNPTKTTYGEWQKDQASDSSAK